jgi:hypothetical protein
MFPHFAASPSSSSMQPERPLAAKGGTVWARIMADNFAYMSTSFHLGIFHMPQIYDIGPTALLALRRKACWGFFRPEKSWRLRPGLNPRTWLLRPRMPYAACLESHKGNPITGLDRPWGFQEVEAPRFQDNRHMKVASLSALRTGLRESRPLIIQPLLSTTQTTRTSSRHS